METVFAKIMEVLSGVEGQAAILVIVLEFALRLFKTEKPKSILLVVGKVFEMAGAVCTKVAEVLNKIVPQNLK